MDMQAPAQPIEYCFLWINHWTTCMDKPSWASWIQAIGSIAAIVGSICLTRWQDRRSISLHGKREQQAKRTWLHGTVGALIFAKMKVQSAVDGLADSADVNGYLRETYANDNWDAIRKTLDQIQMNEAGSPGLTLLLINAKTQFEESALAIERMAQTGVAMAGQLRLTTWSTANNCNETLGVAIKECRRLIDRIDNPPLNLRIKGDPRPEL